jgi:hypothetical protein
MPSLFCVSFYIRESGNNLLEDGVISGGTVLPGETGGQ